MEHGNKNNMSAIMEYPFDFQHYIEERLRDIDDLEERRFAKKILLDGMGKAINCMEKKYEGLQRRVYIGTVFCEMGYEALETLKKANPFYGTFFLNGEKRTADF